MQTREELLEKLKYDYRYFSRIPDEIRNLKEFAILSIIINPMCYRMNTFIYKEDIDIIKLIMKTSDPKLISYLEFNQDRLKEDSNYMKLYLKYLEIVNNYKKKRWSEPHFGPFIKKQFYNKILPQERR